MLQMARNATNESSGSSAASSTFPMIAIRSSALRFWMFCDPVVYGHWLFRHAESESGRFCRALGLFLGARFSDKCLFEHLESDPFAVVPEEQQQRDRPEVRLALTYWLYAYLAVALK